MFLRVVQNGTINVWLWNILQVQCGTIHNVYSWETQVLFLSVTYCVHFQTGADAVDVKAVSHHWASHVTVANGLHQYIGLQIKKSRIYAGMVQPVPCGTEWPT